MSTDLRPVCSIPDGSPRAAHFLEVFGRLADIPITSWLPSLAIVADLGDQEVHMLDLTRVTPEERERLIANIARRFNAPPGAVIQQIADEGLPLLAKDIIVAIPLRLII